jgi:hypothetical protein
MDYSCLVTDLNVKRFTNSILAKKYTVFTFCRRNI